MKVYIADVVVDRLLDVVDILTVIETETLTSVVV